MKKFLLIFLFFAITSFAEIPEEFATLGISLLNLPFPPYQRNVVRLVETPGGDIYGIISESRFCKGAIFVLDKNESIKPVAKLPDDILQVDSIIFNPDLSWTWDQSFSKIIVLDNSGVLKIYEKDAPGKEIAKISGTRPFEPQSYQISRAFAFDKQGNIYTAGKDGFLYKLDIKTYKTEKLKARLPSVYGRQPWASMDAATLADDGTIYIGTYDGYIVKFDPENQTIINLGKPFRQQRIQALVYYKNVIFGIGGEPDGLPRWFIYDPATRGFEPGGTLRDEKNKLIYEPVNLLFVTTQGRIYGSFSGRLGSLFKVNMGRSK